MFATKKMTQQVINHLGEKKKTPWWVMLMLEHENHRTATVGSAQAAVLPGLSDE